MKTIKIKITKEHQAKQKGYMCSDCLLGTALKEKFGPLNVGPVGSRLVKIKSQWYYINDKDKIYRSYIEPVKFPFTVILKPQEE